MSRLPNGSRLEIFTDPIPVTSARRLHSHTQACTLHLTYARQSSERAASGRLLSLGVT